MNKKQDSQIQNQVQNQSLNQSQNHNHSRYNGKGTYGNSNNRGHRSSRENVQTRDSNSFRGNNRENSTVQGGSPTNVNSSRYNRTKGHETIEDIKTDILRIEKEIQLELKEIRSLKL